MNVVREGGLWPFKSQCQKVNLSTRWGVGGQCHAPANLPPGKTQYPLYRRLGRPQGWSGQVWQISPPMDIRSPDSPACSESLYWLRL